MPPGAVIVVGAGPAGCAAAVQCRRLGLGVRLIDRRGEPGGLVANAHRIENYPAAGKLSGPQLARRLAEHLAAFEVRVERATASSFTRGRAGRYALETDAGHLEGDCLIVATGTRPLSLEIPGAAEQMGERLFHEVRDLLARVPRPGAVWIVGGGEAAFDYALTLEEAGARVALLLRGPRPRACARLIAQVAGRPRIEVRARAVPAGIRRVGPRLVLSLGGRGGSGHPPPRGRGEDASAPLGEIAGDAGLVAIGRRSAADDLIGPRAAGGARAMRLRPGLFVAGDARWGALGQAGMAVGDGIAAALLAAEDALSGKRTARGR